MDELQHECGVAAVYHLETGIVSSLIPVRDRKARDKDDKSDWPPEEAESFDEAITRTSRMIPGMLLDMQNRGQLAAGFTTYKPGRLQLMMTHKDVGGVAEVFRMNQEEPYKELMAEYAGHAAIGHVRYATCGTDHQIGRAHV